MLHENMTFHACLALPLPLSLLTHVTLLPKLTYYIFNVSTRLNIGVTRYAYSYTADM